MGNCNTNLSIDRLNIKSGNLDDREKVDTSNSEHINTNEIEGRTGSNSDIELFKQPPPPEDCPICFIRLPTLRSTGSRYQECCGKVICSGCVYALNKAMDKICPFCRTPNSSVEEETAVFDFIALKSIKFLISEPLCCVNSIV